MMKNTVYLETTIFSFYYDERAESLYRQNVTRDWWNSRRSHYDLYTSYFVMEEVAGAVYPNRDKVVDLASKVKQLDPFEELKGIIKVYIEQDVMPADDAGDAAHLAMASYHEIDYLMTWNCRHLANANKFDHIRAVNMKLGLLTPELVTPELLLWGGVR
ncbi:MAG: type II toxin-antitoxin system VapC family toxin [Kiritimatiellia bacterium]